MEKSTMLRAGRFVAARSLLLAAFIAVGALASAQPGEGGGPPPANVEILGVEEFVIREEVSLTGSVVPKWGTFVSSDVEGIVSQMIADNGEFVAKGAPLLELRADRQRFIVAQAEADVALRQAALDELLNGTRREDVAVSEARVEAARARVALTEATEQRQAGLVKSNIVSQNEYDKARAELLEARADLALRDAELSRDRVGARDEAIAAARAELAAAQARLGEERDILQRHTIRAPFSGVLARKNAQTGEWVELGEAVFALAIIDPLHVKVALPEQYISRIAMGAPARVTIDALDGRVFEGKVAQRTPIADDEARTYPVEIEISNADLKVAPGMFARATIELERKDATQPETPSMLVPRDAVVMSPDGTRTVWVAEEKDGGLSAAPRGVEIGRPYRGLIEIKGDTLKKTDRVVVRGNEGLFPGRPLISVGQPKSPLQPPSPLQSAISSAPETKAIVANDPNAAPSSQPPQSGMGSD